MKFDEIYNYASENPEAFWGEIAENVHWYKKWDKVLDDSDAPFYRWFAGGLTNVCYNAVDLHVEQGRGINLPSSMTVRSPKAGRNHVS